MEPDTVARLALDFDVLVPAWIPAPFTEQPAVSASDGYYELYWVITGGEPTFLDITGSVGGDIPDFSWYDRNNELVQNAEVGGIPAYRDLTPIYDNVYWEDRGVVYTVSSQGLTDTDSLSLANALVRLEQEVEQPPPSPPAPAILTAPETISAGATMSLTVENGNGAALNATGGTFPDTGGAAYPDLSDATVSWTAPNISTEQAVTFSLIDPSSGSWLAGATTVVLPIAPPTLGLACGQAVQSGDQMLVTVTATGRVVVEASSGSWPPADANIGFEQGAGGSSIAGEIAGGSATLLWQAPETSEARTATITASGMTGAATASCDITVIPPMVPASTSDLPFQTPAPTSATTTGPPANSASTAASAAPTTTAASTSDRSSMRRNRPARSATASIATSTPLPSNRFRLPESDGTGGPLHPRYVGAPEGLGDSEPLVAPTSAPMPPAPRQVRTRAWPSRSQTPVPTESPTPVAAISMDAVEAIIGPEGATLRHPNGAVLDVAPGTFANPSRVILRPVPDRDLPANGEVALISGTGYDIELYDAVGREITQLTRPVSFQIPIPSGIAADGSSVYSIQTNGASRKIETSINGARLQASLIHFSRFAAGEIREPEGIPSWILPWLAVAGIAVLMLVASTVAGAVQRRRVAIRRQTRR